MSTLFLAALTPLCAALNAELVITNSVVAPDGYPIKYVINARLVDVPNNLLQRYRSQWANPWTGPLCNEGK